MMQNAPEDRRGEDEEEEAGCKIVGMDQKKRQGIKNEAGFGREGRVRQRRQCLEEEAGF
jgi:hypothetical protein